MLEKYIKKFSKLNTASGKRFYLEAINFHAPHKPSLLPSIMDMIAQGVIPNNFIEPPFELVDTWNEYWSTVITKSGERLSPK